MPKRDLEAGFDAIKSDIERTVFSETELQFKIPPYQRPYSWEEDQISDFFDDLTDGENSLFIGSFILSDESKEEGFINVIDGQQRLLTISLFMSALRDVAKKHKFKDLADRISRKTIVTEDRSGENKPRVVAGALGKEFLAKIQAGNEQVDSQKVQNEEEKRLRDNYVYLVEKIDAKVTLADESAKQTLLQDYWDRVANLRIIKILVPSEEEAYEVFETVNARGLELSVADLLKNLIFKKLASQGDEKRQKVVRAWEEMQLQFAEADADLTRFVRHYWLSTRGMITEKRLYKEIRRRISSFDQFLDSLIQNSELYVQLVSPEVSDWAERENGEDLRRILVGIRAMGISQCYVVLLSLARNADKLPDVRRVFRTIENFSFVYSTVCNRPANKVERLYSTTATQIDNSVQIADEKKRVKEVSRVLDTFLEALRKLKPPQSEFESRFGELVLRNSEKGRILTKYILQKISDGESTGEFLIDFSNVNLEHLLPRKPSAEWGLKKNEIGPFLNKLGNLTLVSKKINSKIQNKTIDKKLEDLKKSEIPMTKKLVAEFEQKGTDWGRDKIEQRQREFAKVAWDTIWKF